MRRPSSPPLVMWVGGFGTGTHSAGLFRDQLGVGGHLANAAPGVAPLAGGGETYESLLACAVLAGVCGAGVCCGSHACPPVMTYLLTLTY